MNDTTRRRRALLAAIVGSAFLALCSGLFGNFGERSPTSGASRPMPD